MIFRITSLELGKTLDDFSRLVLSAVPRAMAEQIKARDKWLLSQYNWHACRDGAWHASQAKWYFNQHDLLWLTR